MNRLNNPKFLKAFYRFNNNTLDYSGHGNNGVVAGVESYVPTLFDKSGYSFTNVNTTVVVADNPVFSFGTGEFSISGWVNMRSAPSVFHVLMSKGNALNAVSGFAITTNSTNNIGIIVKDGIHLRATTPLTLNKWHYVTFTRLGTNYSIYIDGVLNVVYSATASDITIANSLIFGRDIFAVYGSDGSISDIRFYNVALTQTEVQQLYKQSVPNIMGSVSLDPSLVFSTRDGVKDLTGKNTLVNQGAIIGSKISVVPDVYVQVNNDVSLNPSSALTIVGVFDVRTTAFNRYPLYKLNNYEISYRDASSNANGFGGSVWDSTGTNRVRISSLQTNSSNKKYHVVLTGTANGSLRIYVNGVLANTVAFPYASFGNSVNNLRLGSAATGFGYTGDILDARIYNESKSADWVKNDYQKAIVYW